MTGRISDERFTELSADYEAEQRELKERAAAIQAELSKAQEATVNAEKFMNVVRRHTSFEELTPTLLREFVEKIVVHECSYDENKTRRQDIEIYFFFCERVARPNNRPTFPQQGGGPEKAREIFFFLLFFFYITQEKRESIYTQAARDLAKRAEATKAGTLTERWVKDYQKRLKSASEQLRGELGGTILSGMRKSAGLPGIRWKGG